MPLNSLHFNIKIRLIDLGLSSLLGSMIYPFMAIYLAERLGGTITGILLAINIILAILAGFYGGYFSDLYGRKKIIVIAELVRFFSVVIMAVANVPSLNNNIISASITISMMTIILIGSALTFPSYEAMLIDVSDQSQRKLMYTIMYWINNLALAIGSAIGGFFFKDYLFLLLIGLTMGHAISLILITFFIKETYIPNPKHRHHEKGILSGVIKSYALILKDKVFSLFIIAALLILSLEYQLTNYIAVELERNFEPIKLKVSDDLFFNIDGVNTLAILRVENTLIIVALMLWTSVLLKKFSERKIFISGLLLFSLGYVVLSYSNNLVVLLIFMFIACIGELLYAPIQETYFSRIPTDDLRGSYIAAKESAYRLGGVIGSLFIILGEYLPKYLISLLLLTMAVIGIVIFLLVISKIKEGEHFELEKSSQANSSTNFKSNG
jgi:MFS transporter, DHA1 family, multidrug resistance protein B